MEEPYLHTGRDHFLDRFPRRFMDEVDGWADAVRDGRLVALPRVGPLGLRLFDGMYAAVAALAEAGNNVIVDDVIHDPRVLASAVARLSRLTVLFVGVRCPVDVAERRDRERGDRTTGEARVFASAVHAHGAYDVEIDTSAQSPEDCTRRIRDALANGAAGGAFSRLREAQVPSPRRASGSL